MKYDADGLNTAKKRTNEILIRSIMITQFETKREEKKKTHTRAEHHEI